MAVTTPPDRNMRSRSTDAQFWQGVVDSGRQGAIPFAIGFLLGFRKGRK